MNDVDVLVSLAPQFDKKFIQNHIDSLDYSYSRSFPPRQIIEHLKSLSLNQNILIESTKLGAFWEILIIAKDYVGLFPVIAGAMNVSGLEVVEAKNFSYKEYSVGQKWTIDQFLVRAEVDFKPDLFSNSLKEFDELARKQGFSEFRKYIYGKLRLPSHSAKLSPFDVVVSQEEEHTLLSIKGEDTPLFLFFLSNALSVLGVQILKFRIKTKSGVVDDKLHLVDRMGKPLHNQKELEKLGTTVTMIKQFSNYLPDVPNKSSALKHFYSFLQSYLKDDVLAYDDDQVMHLMAKAFGASEFLWEEFSRIQGHNLLPFFRNLESLKVRDIDYSKELDFSTLDFDRAIQEINNYKDKELYRLDLSQLVYPSFTFAEFSDSLGKLAEACVQALLNQCLQKLHKRFGVPCIGDRPCGWSMLALGKFGSNELGYASDLELVFLYEGKGKTNGERSTDNQDFFNRLIALFRKSFKAKTDGIFELDFRLRPYGADGPLSSSYDYWKEYMEQHAHAIEIQSYTRMRIIDYEGEVQQILQFQKSLVYQKRGAAPFLDMREKQLQMHTHGVENAKYSKGALADLEYTVQFYQMEFGESKSFLRQGSIPELLRLLLENHKIEPHLFENLGHAYAFFRRLINALRMDRGDAKDLNLPLKGSTELKHLLRRLNMLEGEEELFWEIWKESTYWVQSFFDQYFYQKEISGANNSIAKAIVSGFEGDEDFLAKSFGHPNGDFLKEALVRLYNIVEDESTLLGVLVESAPLIKASANPEKVTRFLEKYISEAENFDGLLNKLLYTPYILKMIIHAFGQSEFISHILIRNPRIVFKLLDTGELKNRKGISHFQQEVAVRVSDDLPFESKLQRLCRYRNREYLRIALRDFYLEESLDEIVTEISDLSDALVQGVYDLVLEDRSEQDCKEKQSIIAFGKLGARELNYSSDIDIAFVQMEDGKDLTKLNKQLLKALSMYTPYGQLFRVDTALRPYGQQGALVTTEAHYLRYYQEEADGWEGQIWLKARTISGAINRGEDFIAKLHLWMATKPAQWMFDSVADLRTKVLSRLEKRNHLEREVKSGAWGIRTIEFWIQNEILKILPLHPWVLTGNTLTACDRLLQIGELNAEKINKYRQHYIWLRRIEHILQLDEMQQEHLIPEEKEKQRELILRMGYEERLGNSVESLFNKDLQNVKKEVLVLHEELFATKSVL